MTDVFSPEKRSEIMSCVRGKDTRPEKLVRSVLHAMGYRFRLHVKDLPGRPDIVLSRHRKVIFVHGCLWHGHEGCGRARRPSTNREFWDAKIEANVRRDRDAVSRLVDSGWDVLTVWGCQIRPRDALVMRLEEFLQGGGRPIGADDGIREG